MAQEKTPGGAPKKPRSNAPRATAAQKAAARMSAVAPQPAAENAAAAAAAAVPPPAPPSAAVPTQPLAQQERMGALGMLETRGLVAALEASDAMVKAAKVRLIGSEKIGSGLVSVMVTGEVSAVRAAVEAGGAAAAELGEIYALHVIPNPHPSVEDLLPTIK